MLILTGSVDCYYSDDDMMSGHAVTGYVDALKQIVEERIERLTAFKGEFTIPHLLPRPHS